MQQIATTRSDIELLTGKEEKHDINQLPRTEAEHHSFSDAYCGRYSIQRVYFFSIYI